jgi:Zn-dependent protease with chaperone function
MFPLQFIILLVVASAPLQMDLLIGGSPALQLPLPAWILFVSFFATHLLLVSFVWSRTRGAIRALHATPTGAAEISHNIDQLFFYARWAVIGLTATHLFCTPLAKIVLAHTESAHIIQYIPGLPETLFITPAVLAWLGIWTASYHVEIAMHERSLPYRLARQEPVHDMPMLGEFLGMQARHNFFPYVMVLMVGVFDKVGKYLTHWYPGAPEVASVAATATVFLVLPFVLVRVWRTAPLDGPLRKRLDHVADVHRLRFRNILLWRTHNLVPNAAILGWLPFGRYFLMSDSLVESFSDKQLEAVFAHEVGHGVHRHMPWFLAIITAACAFSFGVGGLATHVSLPGMSGEMLAMTLSSLVLLIIGGGAFYFIAPRFEHQADWFAARHMSKSSPAPDSGEDVSLRQYVAGTYPHAADPHASLPPAEATDALMAELEKPRTPAQEGTEIFISALDTLVETLHRDRTRRDLMHPSPDDRVALLRTLTTDPAAEEKFNRSMQRTRLVIVLLLVAGIAVAAVAAVVGEKPVKPPAASQPATQVGPATTPAATSPAAASRN